MQGKLIKGWERLVGINRGGVAKVREKNKTKTKRFLFGLFIIKTNSKFYLDVK